MPKFNISEIEVPELNVDTLISPLDQDRQGIKLIVIGKPGSGKSWLIKSLLYRKKHLIPVGIIMSETENVNHEYEKIIPNSFIFNKYDEQKISDFITRQKLAIKYLENPFAFLVIDDCTDDKKIFNKPLQQQLFKYGRHWKMLYILASQYCMDLPKSLRSLIDGVFILREPNDASRKSLWLHYGSIIPSFDIFCSLMDQITDDFSALYIHNFGAVNDWTKSIFWYKAKKIPDGFKMGCTEYWEFHNIRYNSEYQEEFI